jgi:hypothetical protein
VLDLIVAAVVTVVLDFAVDLEANRGKPKLALLVPDGKRV